MEDQDKKRPEQDVPAEPVPLFGSAPPPPEESPREAAAEPLPGATYNPTDPTYATGPIGSTDQTGRTDQTGQAPQAPPPARHRGIVGPLLLILVGVLFLLYNLGWIDWSIWELLWRFWPVWLIAIGLDMLLGRRGSWGGILAVGIIVTLVAGGMYYVGVWRSPRDSSEWAAPGASSQAATTIAQPLGDATEARVEISSGVSRLWLQGGADSGTLIQGSVAPLVGEQLDQRHQVDGNTARYTLRSEYQGPWNLARRGRDGRWDLYLSEEVPIALTLSTGVGENDVDLSGVKLTDLQFDTGVGETTVTLPGSGQFQARISCGVGETTIRIPESLAARIRVETGLGDVSVDGGYLREDGYYVSEGWSSAQDRVELEVDGGVGTVHIVTVPSR